VIFGATSLVVWDEHRALSTRRPQATSISPSCLAEHHGYTAALVFRGLGGRYSPDRLRIGLAAAAPGSERPLDTWRSWPTTNVGNPPTPEAAGSHQLSPHAAGCVVAAAGPAYKAIRPAHPYDVSALISSQQRRGLLVPSGLHRLLRGGGRLLHRWPTWSVRLRHRWPP
jgi:hypothetical protein